MNEKLPAFTLYELIIVMVISSIVVTAIFGLIWRLENMTDVLSKTDMNALEDAVFINQFKRDITTANWVYMDEENKLICKWTRKKVSYTSDDIVTREIKGVNNSSRESMSFKFPNTQHQNNRPHLIDTITLRTPNCEVSIVKTYAYKDLNQWYEDHP